jgi:hypothetical protein
MISGPIIHPKGFSMRTRLLLVSLCLLFVCSVVAAKDPELFRPATPEELAMKDVPFAPGASAVVLDWVS